MAVKQEIVYTNDKRSDQLLFLHGYLADKRTFNYQLPYFNRFYDVFAFDLKGFGENKGMDFPYSLDDYINSVKEYMYKNSINCPDVIAHSFGGRIALKGSAVEKGLFNRLVLTGCAGLKPRKNLAKFMRITLFNALKPILKKEKLQRFYSEDYRCLDEVMKVSFIKIVSEYLDGYLGSIKNKTLIINGNRDKETPLYMAKRLHKGISDSSLVIIPDAGHFSFIDKPHKFNQEVKEFLLS